MNYPDPNDDDRFCDRCGVVRELHSDPDDPTEADCRTAVRKTELMGAFFSLGSA